MSVCPWVPQGLTFSCYIVAAPCYSVRLALMNTGKLGAGKSDRAWEIERDTPGGGSLLKNVFFFSVVFLRLKL